MHPTRSALCRRVIGVLVSFASVCAICVRWSLDRFLCGSFSANILMWTRILVLCIPLLLGEMTDRGRAIVLYAMRKKVMFFRNVALETPFICFVHLSSAQFEMQWLIGNNFDSVSQVFSTSPVPRRDMACY